MAAIAVLPVSAERAPRCLAFRPDAGQAERLGMATDLAATFRQGGAALEPV